MLDNPCSWQCLVNPYLWALISLSQKVVQTRDCLSKNQPVELTPWHDYAIFNSPLSLFDFLRGLSIRDRYIQILFAHTVSLLGL